MVLGFHSGRERGGNGCVLGWGGASSLGARGPHVPWDGCGSDAPNPDLSELLLAALGGEMGKVWMKALSGGCQSSSPCSETQEMPKESVGMYSLPASLPWRAPNPEAWPLLQSCSVVPPHLQHPRSRCRVRSSGIQGFGVLRGLEVSAPTSLCP